MRYACLASSAPGDSFAARCGAIARAGCAGVEGIVFPTTNLEAWQAEVAAATRDAGLEVAAVIVGGLALHRDGQTSYLREAICTIHEAGATALLTPEYAAQSPLPLFPPFPAPPEAECARVRDALREVGALAERIGARIVVEPITPFESRFCRSVADALALCDAAGSARVAVALDSHNMNITEADIGASIHAARGRIGHVHLADNNRLLPGHGHIDFAALLAALREVGYDGWLSFECAAPGDFADEIRRATQRLDAL